MTDGFFPEGMDATTLADRIRMQREHQLMHLQMDVHTVQKFINGLDHEGLKALMLMITSCAEEKNISYFIGRIHAREEYEFGECPCGTEHTDLDEVLKNVVPKENVANPSGEHPEHYGEPIPTDDVDLSTADSVAHDAEAAERLVQTMAVYRLEPHPDYKTEGWEEKYEVPPAPFRCIDCGQNYQSVEDRLLRPPGIDGCNGCKIKSAHG